MRDQREQNKMREMQGGEERKCYKCRQPGHFKRECPLWKKEEELTSLMALEGEDKGDQGFPFARPQQQCLIHLQVGSKGEDTTFLVDTGDGHSSLMFKPQGTKFSPEKKFGFRNKRRISGLYI